MVVVDTNIIVYFYVTSTQSHVVQQLVHIDSNWVVPYLWRSEFRNAIVQYMRHRNLTLSNALTIVERAESRLSGREVHVSSQNILSLAQNSTCSAYDCEFVALANQLQIPLITEDKKVLREFPHIASSLAQFISSRTRSV